MWINCSTCCHVSMIHHYKYVGQNESQEGRDGLCAYDTLVGK